MLASAQVPQIHSLILERVEALSTQVFRLVEQIHTLALGLAVLTHSQTFKKLSSPRKLLTNMTLIPPVSSLGLRFSNTWTHTCRMWWMFRSVRPVKTLAEAKQREMQGQ
jgi:hypothetical protein